MSRVPGNFQKQSAKIFVSIFIGLIVISFIFTGYQYMEGGSNTVATVNGQNIILRDFNHAYSSTLEFYRNLFGGRSLSNRQIEQMNIKSRIMDELIQRKILFEVAEDMELIPGPREVKNHIKNQSSFFTNEAFDIRKYKSLLRANDFTPEEYENNQTEDIAITKIQTLLKQYPISSHYMDDIHSFKKDARTISLVSIEKRALAKFISVSEQEVDTFLKEDANIQRVIALFNDRKASLSKKEEIEASHLLLRTNPSNEKDILKKITDIRSKINPKNFASMVKRHTEDPSGKQDGGTLGRFPRGRMVKKFDDIAFALKKGEISDPVKTDFGYHIIYLKDRWEAQEAQIEEHRRSIAKELIQRTKTSEEKELIETVKQSIVQSLETKNSKTRRRTLTTIQERYQFTIEHDILVNRYDGTTGQIPLSEEQLASIFQKEAMGKVHVFDNAAQVTLVGVYPTKNPEKNTANVDKNSIILNLSRKLSQNIISEARENASITVNPSLIR